MKHNQDWSKSHNGVMLGSFKFTRENMPELSGVLDEVIPLLEGDVDDYLVDVKIHMLMPDQFPCIPNWHFDFRQRDSEGSRSENATISDKKMYMWLSGTPLTIYRNKVTGEEYTKPAQEWHSFTQRDLHKGARAEEFTWRCFIRVIPKEFVHSTTLNVGTLRRHTQVYLDSEKFRW